MAQQALTLEFEFRNRRYQDAEVGLRAFADVLSQDISRGAPVLSKELRNFLDTVAEALAQRHSAPWGGTVVSSSPNLQKRSGAATQSIQESVEVTGNTLDTIRGGIGGVSYLKTHEYGATIRPKTAKYLTIPLPAALNANGTPKKKSARDWDRTFVLQSKAGNLLIVQRNGRSLTPLYLLKTEVKIPPRLQMGKTLEAGLPYFVDRAMDAMVKELMKE